MSLNIYSIHILSLQPCKFVSSSMTISICCLINDFLFKWEFLPILQNRAEDRFIYQISVSVGKTSSKDFDTDVYCVIYGAKGKTSPKALKDGKRKVSLTSYNCVDCLESFCRMDLKCCAK